MIYREPAKILSNVLNCVHGGIIGCLGATVCRSQMAGLSRVQILVLAGINKSIHKSKA
jgi:hypothetical protein